MRLDAKCKINSRRTGESNFLWQFMTKETPKIFTHIRSTSQNNNRNGEFVVINAAVELTNKTPNSETQRCYFVCYLNENEENLELKLQNRTKRFGMRNRGKNRWLGREFLPI